MGLGEMGMTVEELYNMTPREFANKRAGHLRAVEYQTQLVWETTRWLGAVTVQPHTKKTIRPGDLATFPWDNKKKTFRAASFEEVQEGIKQVFGER